MKLSKTNAIKFVSKITEKYRNLLEIHTHSVYRVAGIC